MYPVRHCLLLPLFLAALAGVGSSAPSICKSNFVTGSCVCDLANGDGVIDLTAIGYNTAIHPLVTAGVNVPDSYFLTFCGPIQNSAGVACLSVSSSCETDVNGIGTDLGRSDTTRFEMRTGPDDPHPTPAVVMDTPNLGKQQRRSIIFMFCDPNADFITYTSWGNKNNATDTDGFSLYYMHVTGQEFCPRKPVPKKPCKSDFKEGQCVCELEDGSGTIDLTDAAKRTSINPLFNQSEVTSSLSYYLTFCNVLNLPKYHTCDKTSAACEVLHTDADYGYDLGHPNSTRFEYRVSPQDNSPGIALVMDADGRTSGDKRRSIIFLICDATQTDIIFNSWGNEGSLKDPDGYFLYFMHVTGRDFCPKNPKPKTPCKANFKQGSCVCELEDGSGTIDLTALSEQTKQQPLFSRSEIDPNLGYLLSFCGKMIAPTLSSCDQRAASCEFRYDGVGDGYDLGNPNTTRFEFRTSPEDPNATIALVMDATDKTPADTRRSVIFLFCDPKSDTVTMKSWGNQGTAKDPDGYFLYYTHVTGSAFCPVKNTNPCTSDSKVDKCICKMADGSGKTLDLTSLVQQSQIFPFTTLNARFTYSYAFCSLLHDAQWGACYNRSSACEYSEVWDYDIDISEPSTVRFEWRTGATHPKQALALVSDAHSIDGISRRTVAFLNCRKDVPTINFNSYGYKGQDDKDGYFIYEMDFIGSEFCY